MGDLLGFIPAAGLGTRMKGELVIKELLPILIDGMEEPELLFENSLKSIKEAGIDNVVCTINELKPDLLKYMNLFSRKHQMSMSYIYQNLDSGEYGLPCAIYEASPFLKSHTIVMRFPDTVLMPVNCVKDLLDFHYQKGSVLTLGVFETEHPERLAPVILSEDGKIKEIQDKPQHPLANNTWNCVIWENAFLDVIEELVQSSRQENEDRKELLLIDAFNKCLEKNLPVYGMQVKDGVCVDISSGKDYVKLWKNIM